MSLNHAIVRNLLAQPLSLADLQAAGRVSLPTLRRAVQELADAQWIRIVGQAQANGGRPANLFGIDSSHFLLVGVHLQLPGMRLIGADLTGNVLDERKLLDKAVPLPDEAVQAIVDYVYHLQAQYPARTVLGIGIAAPGFIDLTNGDIISIGRVPSWENSPICRRLNATLHLPVAIANDVDCMAFAEFQHSAQPRDKNLIYVGFDEGVKASLFLGGDLYKGAMGNAGLIASDLLHVGNEIAPPVVRQLLTVEGINRLFEEQWAMLDANEQARYDGIAVTTNPRTRFRLILACADEQRPICAAIVHDLIAVLAAAVANVIFFMQPDVIVVGGLLSSLSGTLFGDLEFAVRDRLPQRTRNNVIIQQARLVSKNSAAIGANQHFLREYLSDASVSLP
jgi:predicted NBD/HSP70 family sugar kinase